jgi:thioredoxin-related protein
MKNTLVNTTLRHWLVAAIAACTLGFASADELWTEDFAAAKTQAGKDKKDLLMDFTGSDWCSWCVKLKEEVFNKKEFKDEAPKQFVLVELDFPQQKEQPENIKKQNAELNEKFAIEGFPTIVLADSLGRPYAKTGYAPGGPVPYLKQLNELKAVREKRDAAFAKAEKAEGLEKAKALQEGLKEIDPGLVSVHYKTEVDQIISLDKDDTLGMKKGREVAEASQALQTKLEELHQENKFPEFSKTIDEFIATWKLEGSEKQRMLMQKLAIYGPESLDDAEKLVDEIIKIDAKTEIGEQAAQVKSQIGNMRAAAKSEKKEGGESAPKEDPAEKEAAPAKGEKL